jgi:hypothetical protein
VVIDQAVDIAVKELRVPPKVACERTEKFPYSFVTHNPSSRELKVPFKVTVSGRRSGSTRDLYWGTMLLKPGDNTTESFFQLDDCDDVMTLRVAVNLGPEPRPVPEPDYSNNARQATVTIPPYQVTLPTMEAGKSRTIIVPADCQVNPDITSKYPCLNYPDLRHPGD